MLQPTHKHMCFNMSFPLWREPRHLDSCSLVSARDKFRRSDMNESTKPPHLNPLPRWGEDTIVKVFAQLSAKLWFCW